MNLGGYAEDDVAEPVTKDQGFGGDRTQADAMANIEEWDNETAAAGHGNEEFNRTGSWRGNRGGRGRGSGTGGYRGERRGN